MRTQILNQIFENPCLSQFLTKDKYDEILQCLQAWDTHSAAEGRQQWPQHWAWHKKYSVFRSGETAALIFNDSGKEADAAGELAEIVAGEQDAAPAAASALDTRHASYLTRAVSLRTCWA